MYKNHNRMLEKKSLKFFSVVRKSEGQETLRLSEARRRLWLARIRRKDEPSQYSRVCSDHFVNGEIYVLKLL